jgi:RNA polymerase sigma-70 factor (ECF subfamily)
MRFLPRRQHHDHVDPPGDPDGRLVAWAQQNPQAFAALYDRYFPAVYGYCLSQLGDPHAAEDAASQTFLKALAALPGYRETGRFRSWLFAIAHNVVLDAITRRRPETSLEAAGSMTDPDPSPEEQAIAALEWSVLEQAIARLSPDDRSVLELRRAGLTGHEIAAALGIGHEAAKKRQLRALDRVRAELTVTVDNSEVRYGA